MDDPETGEIAVLGAEGAVEEIGFLDEFGG
jgi:hypothetical protein